MPEKKETLQTFDLKDLEGYTSEGRYSPNASTNLRENPLALAMGRFRKVVADNYKPASAGFFME